MEGRTAILSCDQTWTEWDPGSVLEPPDVPVQPARGKGWKKWAPLIYVCAGVDVGKWRVATRINVSRWSVGGVLQAQSPSPGLGSFTQVFIHKPVSV